MTNRATEWRALFSQQWVNQKILGQSSGSSAKNVKFSDKNQKNTADKMKRFREKRDNLYLERLALKAKEGKATKKRIVHLDVKMACIKLIIELGKEVFTKILYHIL